MSLIPNLSDIPDLEPVADGEYDLRVITAKESPSKRTGRNSIMLVCDIVGEDNAQNIIHSIWLPMPSDDASKQEIMLRMIKDFVVAVGLPAEGELDIVDFEDLAFSAILELEENAEYGNRNNIKRIT